MTMRAIVEFLSGWKDLIINVWKEYPFAAALVTLCEIAILYLLGPMSEGAVVTAAIGLLVWAIAVPILGKTMDTLGWLYGLYSAHPVFMAVTTLLFAGAFVAWWSVDPPVADRLEIPVPGWLTRAAVTLALYLIVVAVLAPILTLMKRRPSSSGPGAQPSAAADGASAAAEPPGR
jgi:hypothetical protein